ncbi:MAG: SDR family oxidoreductase [Actinomycetes bacterium]
MGHLDDTVGLVTGAGGGLGRAYALALATAGARVVVNDLGAGIDGGGRGPSSADAVVAEIRAAGGTAVADHSDVASIDAGRALVERAVAEFGRIDTVVHSAGFSHRSSIVDLDTAHVSAHLAVHLHGAIGLVQGAFTSMTRGGSVVLVTSGAGLDPRWPGTTAYACAKAGVYAFARVAAVEGAPLGVRVNALSPVARTRMSQRMLDDEGGPDDLAPALVAPVVVYLASDLARDVTGRTFRVVGRSLGTVRFVEGEPETRAWTPESIAGAVPRLLADDA